MKRLFRSKSNRMLTGILGGVGEFLNIDPTIVRVIFILLLVFTGFFPFLFLYLVLYFIIPGEDSY